MKLLTYLNQLDKNERTYWLGMVMLFLGLCFYASVALALVIVGGAMAAESVLTSYLAAWMNRTE